VSGIRGRDLDVAVDHVDIAVAESRALDANEHLARPRRRRRHVVDYQLVSILV
jgi:hypothetical protein